LTRFSPATREIVWTFKLPEGAKRAILPPEVLRGTERAVLADLIPDPGNVIRRALLYARDKNYYIAAMGMELALRYLAAERIRPAPGAGDELLLGKAVLSPLDDSRGPYVRFDSNGYQILLDYRGGQNPFPLKSIGEIRRNDNAASLVRGRVVIVGDNSESVHDSYLTPFNTGFNHGHQMNGIVVHAHIADQLIREAVEGGPVLRGLPRAYAALFFWFWCVAGALAGAVLNTPVRIVGVVVAGSAYWCWLFTVHSDWGFGCRSFLPPWAGAPRRAGRQAGTWQ
jgi:CHASE2 domain-containing sensor protein